MNFLLPPCSRIWKHGIFQQGYILPREKNTKAHILLIELIQVKGVKGHHMEETESLQDVWSGKPQNQEELFQKPCNERIGKLI